MSIRGISVECVASELGALSRDIAVIDKDTLIKSLQRRFQAEDYEAYDAIERAKKVNVVKEFCGKIYLVFPYSGPPRKRCSKCGEVIKE